MRCIACDDWLLVRVVSLVCVALFVVCGNAIDGLNQYSKFDSGDDDKDDRRVKGGEFSKMNGLSTAFSAFSVPSPL